MNLVIDHVTVCGSNLEKMRQDFAGVGLHTKYGGRHANRVTHMDLLTFADGSYIELIAPIGSSSSAKGSGPTGMMSGWSKLMEGNAGAGAWAVRTDDIHAEVGRLRDAGIEVRGPEAGSRERPDGTKLEWGTAIVGPGATGSVLPFLIEDKTPRGLRVPKPERASEIEGVASVVIAVRDLESSIELFRRAYDLEKATVEDHSDAVFAHFPGTPVTLSNPRNAKTWDAFRIRYFGEGPTAFLLKPMAFSRAIEHFGLKDRGSLSGRDIAWFGLHGHSGTRLGLIR